MIKPLAALLLLLAIPCTSFAQYHNTAIGFRSFHADVTLPVVNAMFRTSADWAFVHDRDFGISLGLRTSFMWGQSIEKQHRENGRYVRAYEFLPLISSRTERWIWDAYIGPQYSFTAIKDKDYVWDVHAGTDLKWMAIPEFLGVTAHLSNKDVGVGLSVGYFPF